MYRQAFASNAPRRAQSQTPWVGLLGCLLLTASARLPAGEGVVDIGPAAAPTRVPRWNARGLGQLPWQGIACLDMSEDGRFVAVGTIAPASDPNVFLLDADGKIVDQRRAGHRWVNEVTVSHDGRFVAALVTTPEGTAGDTPRFYAFRQGQELTQLSDKFRFRDFRPCGGMFHYGEHSNHLPRSSRWAGDRWVVAGDDQIVWLSPSAAARDGEVPAEPRGSNGSAGAASSQPELPSTSRRPALHQVHLGQGVTTAFAASIGGLAVVGRFGGIDQAPGKFQDLLVVQPDQLKSIVWSRPVRHDVASSPQPEQGVYGAPAPPYQDVKFQAPLAVAIDSRGAQIAVADYQGWQRMFQPRDGSADIPFGTRFMPSHPTIHIYDSAGNTLRRIGPDAFAEAFWCDLAFSADGQELLISPHSWTSRGLAGQPFLPADANARTLYVLDIASGELRAVRFPDAISSVDCGGEKTVVSCWDHKVYLLGHSDSPQGRSRSTTHSMAMDVGAASLVRVSKDGQRIAVATDAGTVRMLDADGRELWQTGLDQAAQPGDKPWTKNQRADPLAPGIWRTNGGLAHSDLGSQFLVEAPQGLILIDPNAGASFEQNWARIQAAGKDPRQLKYILLTHEHGDHAPGAYLWRVMTGAQVVASTEMAYLLQHHIPGGTGYGFHPPVPVDITLTGDQELDLAGLKVRALRLPGHTSGSLGYAFAKEGRTYVATGDLIMPGGVLGYSGSLDFSARDVLGSLRKLAELKPDVVLGGHGGGDPDNFIAQGIAAGEATGWSRMAPERPNPLFRFTQTNYLVAAWLEPILSAAYGDVDGDGRPDVAVLVPQGQGSAVKIYLNKGGRFAAAPDAQIDLPGLSRGWKLRIVRLGSGQFADFFVSSESQVMLLLSQAERPGQLKFKVTPLPVTRGAQVVTGDFHGDGRTDLLIGSRFVAGYYLASQREDGVFQVRQTQLPRQSYWDIQLADVNGDQRADLLTSCGDIFLRQPDGSLAETPALHLTPPSGELPGWSFMAAADFDQDGGTDVALLAGVRDGTAVWIYRNTRDPQNPFPKEPSVKFVVPDTVISRDGPTVADWNGDGIPDLLLGQKGQPSSVIILTGAPSDGLNPQRTVTVKLDYVPHFDTRFGVADFNGDGRPDLAGFGPSPAGAVGVYIWLQN